MKFIEKLYSWYGKKTVWSVFGVIILLLGAGIFFSMGGKEPTTAEDTNLRSVTVKRAGDLGSESSFNVVGTVEAVSEARLQAESSGRITSVAVQLGDTVAAGTVLASLENNSERAALLQAEGAYESAQVSASSNDVSLSEAETSVRNTYRDTFTSADNAIRGVADEFFSNPRSATPGFKLNSGAATTFNKTRVDLETALTSWSRDISNGLESLSEDQMLSTSETNLRTISDFLSKIALSLSEEKEGTYTATELATLNGQVSAARASVDGALASVSNTRQAYEQAVLGAQSGSVSASSAQLKSALGTLRAAQANYEKTLVRTPISGVVNALYLKAGDYASMGQPAAIVANNGALEIKTSISEKDREGIAVGDTVMLDNTAEGTITRIAPAIDPTTGKIEVRVSVADAATLQNGDTVSISFSRSNTEVSSNAPLAVPLSAFKITAEGPVAFSIDGDNKLVAQKVVLGAITGDMVVVREGLSRDSMIVSDARGLKAGQEVTVTNN